MGVGACGGGEVAPPPGEEEETLPPPEEEEEVAPPPALPKSGEWTASTGSSQFAFTFTVSPDSTGITEICYSLAAFECAGWVVRVTPRTVTPSTVKSPPWTITGGQFTIDFVDWLAKFPEPGTSVGMVIKGKFDETGTHASGTWEISFKGTTCPAGTWEASPSS